MKPRFLWMAVEADEYELPIAVADNAEELGLMLGIAENTVRHIEYEKCDGRQSGRRIVKVRYEEDELVE